MRSFLLAILLVFGRSSAQLVIGDGSPLGAYNRGHLGSYHQGGLDIGEHTGGPLGPGDPESVPELISGSNSGGPFVIKPPQKTKWVREKGGRLIEVPNHQQGGLISGGFGGGPFGNGDPESVPELISGSNSGGPFAIKPPQKTNWIREKGGRLVEVLNHPQGGLISEGPSGGPLGSTGTGYPLSTQELITKNQIRKLQKQLMELLLEQ
ncbi:uncharacterized protein LOC119550198 [Drosophila subpulchrella]|uniref:uncharacterized protein LOC119550198 n=1 Tax=Drosophila subpulchrella TaxID=1486046 RepID=UPI0018A187BC|nr:uncharacterized protein LOC119550198 [Drosophila subpulchrella]